MRIKWKNENVPFSPVIFPLFEMILLTVIQHMMVVLLNVHNMNLPKIWCQMVSMNFHGHSKIANSIQSRNWFLFCWSHQKPQWNDKEDEEEEEKIFKFNKDDKWMEINVSVIQNTSITYHIIMYVFCDISILIKNFILNLNENKLRIFFLFTWYKTNHLICHRLQSDVRFCNGPCYFII